MPRCPWSGAECGCSQNGHGWPFPENGKMPKRCHDMLTIVRAPHNGHKKPRPAIVEGNRERRERALGSPCPYCNRIMEIGTGVGLSPTIDHIVPRAKGGTRAANNSAIVCARCNGDKDDLDIAAWLAALTFAGDPRAVYVGAFVRARAPA